MDESDEENNNYDLNDGFVVRDGDLDEEIDDEKNRDYNNFYEDDKHERDELVRNFKRKNKI